MPSTEWLVVGLLLAIYLADCVILLARGQALLEPRGRRSSLRFGTIHYAIREHPVALLNPFTPFAPAFKTLALYESVPPSALRPSLPIRALHSVRLLVLLQAPLVLVALPLTLYRNDAVAFLIVLGVAYLNALLMLVFLLLGYRRLGAPAGAALALGFGGLVCLPLSVNFFRRALIRLPVKGDARRFLRYTKGAERAAARSDLLAQVSEAVDSLEEGSPLHARLRGLREQLALQLHHSR